MTQGETDPEFFLSMGVLFLLLVGFLYISDLYLFSFSFYFFYFSAVTLAQFNSKPSSSSTATTTITYTTPPPPPHIIVFTDRSVTKAVLSDTKFTSKKSWHTSLHLILPTIKKFGLGSIFFEQHVLVTFFTFFLSFSCQILLSIDLYLSF